MRKLGVILILGSLLLSGCEDVDKQNKRYYDERTLIINACIAQGGVPEHSTWSSKIICRWKDKNEK
jgi:uncharacterized protein YcfL